MKEEKILVHCVQHGDYLVLYGATDKFKRITPFPPKRAVSRKKEKKTLQSSTPKLRSHLPTREARSSPAHPVELKFYANVA